jgi:prepilin-type N-terminal cleavage/methylation domain-containing protein
MPTSFRPFRHRSSGFTLLELMVVIVIIGILMGALLMSGGSIFRDAEVKQTGIRMDTLATLIMEYRSTEQDFPDDRLPRLASATKINASAEALCLSFFDPNYTGSKPNQEWLGNTDEDSSPKSLTTFAKRDLFEILDGWGNPIAYFESMHYNDACVFMAGADGLLSEQTVVAARNATTGGWENPSGFQLISAGEDGDFGTEDDIIR